MIFTIWRVWIVVQNSTQARLLLRTWASPLFKTLLWPLAFHLLIWGRVLRCQLRMVLLGKLHSMHLVNLKNSLCQENSRWWITCSFLNWQHFGLILTNGSSWFSKLLHFELLDLFDYIGRLRWVLLNLLVESIGGFIVFSKATIQLLLLVCIGDWGRWLSIHNVCAATARLRIILHGLALLTTHHYLLYLA